MIDKKNVETSRLARVIRLRPVPAKLGAILELVDLITPDTELPDLSRKFSRLVQNSKESEEKKHVKAHRVVASCLEKLPEAFRRHVWRGGKGSADVPLNELDKVFLNRSPEDSRTYILRDLLKGDDDVLDDIYYGTIEDAVREYSFIRESRDKLRKIVGLASRPDDFFAFFMFPLRSSGTIRVDKEGIVRISNDRFAEAVEGIDATLVRECEICKRIFWAGRRDKSACSTSCAHALRNRRYRERYRQGLYQGARLTEKDKAALARRGRTRRLKGE